MKAHSRIIVWLSSCACLILLTLGVFWWLSHPRSPAADLPTLATNPTLNTLPHSTAQTPAVVNRPRSVDTQTAVTNSQPPPLSIPSLPPVDYPLGTIGEACEVNTYPPINDYTNLSQETALSLENSPINSTGDNWKSFNKEKCRTALEKHINPINPYLWGREDDTHGVYSAPALITIDNPLTFERIFTDPAGDFARVQEALARPECQLNPNTTSNWQLNETCHADAIHNYALIMRVCFGDGIYNRPNQWYFKEDNPTPEQDRSMWIDSLQDSWVRDIKCASLDPNLDLQLPVHTDLRKQIQALQVVDENSSARKQTLIGTLIDLAARLGDLSAGLTYPINHNRGSFQITKPYDEEGYKYGPLVEWFTTDLTDPTNLFSKHPPSVDRLRHLIPLFATHIEASGGKTIKFNHEALAQHLCSPPYYAPPSEDTEAIPEPPSCREIVIELRQESLAPSMLELIYTFEDVAIHLDVYE